MRKNEMLDLHEKMVEIKNAFMQMPDTASTAFEEYHAVGTTPSDTTASKEHHKEALFVLGKCLADVMNEDEFSDVGRIGLRMDELAEEI